MRYSFILSPFNISRVITDQKHAGKGAHWEQFHSSDLFVTFVIKKCLSLLKIFNAKFAVTLWTFISVYLQQENGEKVAN